MWYKGCKFHTKKLDENKKTFDCGMTAIFQVTNVSSRSDTHPQVFENRYYGHLDEITESDFNSFKSVLFDVKSYRLQMNEHHPDINFIQHAKEFTMVNTK